MTTECKNEGFPRSDIDPGILREVEILDAHGVETFESCQGGKGHAFPYPTIRFHGTESSGWKALSVAMDYGMDVMSLARHWDFNGGQPTGPYWEITFRKTLSDGQPASDQQYDRVMLAREWDGK